MINDNLSKKYHHIFGKSVSFWATLIVTLRHIASTVTTRTTSTMPCAPRSHLASGGRDLDGWPGPRPTRLRPPPQFSSNFTIAIFWVRLSQKNACQTHSLSIHLWETKPRWEKAKKKKKNAGWFLAGGSFATFELYAVYAPDAIFRPWRLHYRMKPPVADLSRYSLLWSLSLL